MALPKPTPKATAAALADHESYGTTLAMAAMTGLGKACLGWSPETLRLELRQDFGASLDEDRFGRLMAAIAILTTDRFRGSLPDFLVLANALNGDGYRPDMFDPVDAAEAAWAVAEATFLERLVLRPEDVPAGFAPEIATYVAAALKEDGIVAPPPFLGGLGRDPDAMGAVLADYSDDPTLAAAIVAAEDDKRAALTEAVRGGLARLAAQLGALFGLPPDEFLREARLR